MTFPKILSFVSLLLGLTAASFAYAEELEGDWVGSDLFENVVIGGQVAANASPIARASVALSVTRLTKDGKYVREMCSGTLIAKDMVLTAAHCLVDLDTGDKAAQIYVMHIAGDAIKPILAANWKVHEHYKVALDITWSLTLNRQIHDIALVHLSLPVDKRTLIANLPSTEMPLNSSQKIVIAGFGKTDVADSLSAGILHWAHSTGQMLTVANNQDHQILMIGKQICGGDSGGPIFEGTTEPLTVIGVNSHTTDKTRCTDGGHAISVFPYINWIKQTAQMLRSARSI